VIRARLAAMRSHLLMRLVGRPRRDLEEAGADGVSPADALVGLAAGDWAAARRLNPAIPGRTFQRVNRTIEEAVEHAHEARASLLAAYALLAEPLAPGVAEIMGERAARDAAWSVRLGAESGDVGPARVLSSAMRAARKELLTVIALIPLTDRPELAPDLAPIAVTEAQLLAALTGQTSETCDSWPELWRGLHRTHHSLLEEVDRLTEPGLARRIGPVSLYGRLGRVAYSDIRLAALLRARL